jgi:PHP family Zn ribbon phosphoesterase
MNKYRADLHIHTLLSPCAGLEMTPHAIVEKAKASGLHIIGITDHNSTKHCLLVKKLAQKEGIFTLTGAEVTTKEEVHCLVFFEHSRMSWLNFSNISMKILPGFPTQKNTMVTSRLLMRMKIFWRWFLIICRQH